MREDIKAYCFLFATIGTSAISYLFYDKYRTYRRYEKEVRDNDVDDVKGVLAKYQNNLDLKKDKSPGKMVYVTGIAFDAKKHLTDIKVADALCSVGEIPSSLITCNPLNSVVTKLSQPNILYSVEKIRYKTRIERSFNSYEEHHFKPFVLIDQNDKEIMVYPTAETELYGVRMQRTTDYPMIVALLELLSILSSSNDRYVCEKLNYIVYEGDIITIGGLLKYNVDTQLFDITKYTIEDVSVIASGGKENLITFFKDMKFTYNVLTKIGVFVTGVLLGFGIYHFLKHRKNVAEEKKKVEFNNLRHQEHIPDEETCIVWMECRRDIIILPCNHLILCRFCFPEVPPKCPHCSKDITGHVLINFDKKD